MFIKTSIRDQKGFTLLEVIVTMVIIGFLGLGISSMFLDTIEGYILAKVANEKFQKTGYAMERLLRETKTMDEINQISSTSILFKRDGINFGIALVGSNLNIIRAMAVPTAGRPGSVLLDNVTAFSLVFENNIGNTWTRPSDNSLTGLSKIKIQLTVIILENQTRTFYFEVNPLYNNMVNGPTS